MAIESPLSRRLKQARLKAGISQKELSIRMGVEPGSASSRVTRYEKGRHAPDFATLEHLSDKLDVPVAYFTCENDVMAKLVCLLEGLPTERFQVIITQLKQELASKDNPDS